MSEVRYQVFYNSRPDGESPIMSEYGDDGKEKAIKDAKEFNGWVLDCKTEKCIYDYEEDTHD